MKANYSVTNGGFGSDFGDLFLPRELFSQGGLWAWGANTNGQLGNNTISNRSSPVQTVASGINWRLVTGGYYHTSAIKTDGTLWTWGFNGYGSLGDNTTTGRSSPVQTISVGTNWRMVACGSTHTAAIKTDGTLWTWGHNNLGQLGNGIDVSNRSSPVQTISGGTNWKQVAGGYRFTAAIKTDGTLWAWGLNGDGQLGNNAQTTLSSPVQTISGGTNWKQVACGDAHTAAIKTDGTLWLWGLNSYGQLGDNTITRRSSPIQTVAAGTNWKQVAGGYRVTAAIKTDGTLWLWGLNDNGQLGNNGATNRSSPVQTVSAGTDWKSCSAGSGFTTGIKTDGTLWIWGRNTAGQLGTNNTARLSSPVQTVSGGSNWKLVATGKYYTAAITDIF